MHTLSIAVIALLLCASANAQGGLLDTIGSWVGQRTHQPWLDDSCQYGPFGQWQNQGGCSVTCGKGVAQMVRARPVLGGSAQQCHDTTEVMTTQCGCQPCFRSGCVWSSWGQWSVESACNRQCGGGIQTMIRTRTKSYQQVAIDSTLPETCIGEDTDVSAQNCNTHQCQVAQQTVTQTRYLTSTVVQPQAPLTVQDIRQRTVIDTQYIPTMVLVPTTVVDYQTQYQTRYQTQFVAVTETDYRTQTQHQTQTRFETQYIPTTYVSTQLVPTTQYVTRTVTLPAPAAETRTRFETNVQRVPQTQYVTQVLTQTAFLTNTETRVNTQIQTQYITNTQYQTRTITLPPPFPVTRTVVQTQTQIIPTTQFVTQTQYQTNYVTSTFAVTQTSTRVVPQTQYITQTRTLPAPARATQTQYLTQTQLVTSTLVNTVRDTRLQVLTETRLMPTTIVQQERITNTQYVTKTKTLPRPPAFTQTQVRVNTEFVTSTHYAERTVHNTQVATTTDYVPTQVVATKTYHQTNTVVQPAFTHTQTLPGETRVVRPNPVTRTQIVQVTEAVNIEEQKNRCPNMIECGEGFTLNSDGGYFNCVDIDECALGNHGCQHDCMNTNGAYRCMCRQGYVLEDDWLRCRPL